VTLRPIGNKQHAHVNYSIENSGNVRLSPTAVVTVTDLWGSTVKRYPPRKFPELLPGQTASVSLPWHDVPTFGLRYTAKVEVTAPRVHETSEASAFVIPWLLVIVLVVLLAGAVWWWRRRRRRLRVDRTPTEGPNSPPEGPVVAPVGPAEERSDEPAITWRSP
jgi:cobalamin biosynthesis Mg chelatase CobN